MPAKTRDKHSGDEEENLSSQGSQYFVLFFPRCTHMNSLWRGPGEVSTESVADVDGSNRSPTLMFSSVVAFMRALFSFERSVFEIPSCKLH